MDPSAYGFCNLMAPFGVNSSTYGLNNEPSSSGLVNLEASLGMDPSTYGLCNLMIPFRVNLST